MGRQHGLGDFCRLQVIVSAILDVNDLELRMLGLHLVEEAVTTVDAGAARLVVHDNCDLACIADRLGHLVGRKPCGRQIVGAAGRQRNVAVDAAVEGDDTGLRIARLASVTSVITSEAS